MVRPVADFVYNAYYSNPALLIDPKRVNPTSGHTIQFLNTSKASNDTRSSSYSWYVDDRPVAKTADFSTKLHADSFDTRHKVRLSVSDGENESSHEEIIVVDPDQLYPISELKVKVKAVVYWPDCNVPRIGPQLREEYIRSDMNLIRDELGCNGIRINSGICAGLSPEWEEDLVRCTEIAMETGFDNVTVGPRYLEATLDETAERVRAFAPRAERLHRISDAIVFEVGNELSIDARGICLGQTYSQRADEIDRNVDKPAYQARLHEFLRRLVSICRESYHGKLSYAAHPGEWAIPWDELDLDIIGQNQYWWPECTDEKWVNIFKRLSRFGKPVHVTEFGCRTYKGSFELGGSGHYRAGDYDEDAQANGIKHYLDVINASEIDGCFLFMFRDELDLRSARFSLVDGTHRKKAFYIYKSYQRGS